MEAAKERIRALAENFPAVWRDPEISHRDRKRIMALLVADVTLTKKHEQIAIGVRFRGGGTTTEMATHLGISESQTRRWRRSGLLRALRYNGRGDCLFEPIERQSPCIQARAACKDTGTVDPRSATPVVGGAV